MTVSVITPTWQRHRLLIDRAIPSVRAQTYPDVQHIVCSDGPDLALRVLLRDEGVTYVQVRFHEESRFNFGSRARNHALAKANGEYMAYLDDDNEWRPEHLALLVDALEFNPSAGFAYSCMLTHPQGTVIGANPPCYGGIDTSLIMHRRELDTVWPRPAQIDGDKHAPDWALVAGWLARGIEWVHVPAVTVDYHFAGS